jgi:hypothetical protein
MAKTAAKVSIMDDYVVLAVWDGCDLSLLCLTPKSAREWASMLNRAAADAEQEKEVE